MLFRSLSPLLFYLCFSNALNAQNLPDTIPSLEYQQALYQMVLLKDHANLIPLRSLDTLQVGYWSKGTLLDDLLTGSMGTYLPIRTLHDPTDPSPPDLLIVTLEKQPDSSFLRQLDSLQAKLPLVILLFQPEQIAFGWDIIGKASVVLRLPDQLPQLGAQLLFGGVGTHTRLPYDLGPFPAGTGIDVAGQLRLGFAPPRWVGIDPGRLADSLNSLIQEGISHRAFPGAQAIVIRRGKIIFQRAYGHHTYDNIQPVDLDNLYDLASITKVTAPLLPLIRWYGEGKFNLDAPLANYATFFRWGDKQDLTFREMLAHQAGLRAWIPYWQGTLKDNAHYPWQKKWNSSLRNNGRFRKHTFNPDSTDSYPIRITDQLWISNRFPDPIYKAIRKSPLRTKKDYRYSGLLFYILPEMIRQLADEDYETLLKKEFYHRLGAYSLTFNPLRYFKKDKIVPTEQDTFFRMQLLHGIVHDEGAAMMQGISGNAGLFGTAMDLAKLLQLYLNRGQYGGEYFFTADAMDEFTCYQYLENGNRRGLGFDKPPIEYKWGESYVGPSASPSSYGHGGYTGTFFWIDPEEELIFIFLSNRVYPTRNNRTLYELNLRPRMHEAVYQAIID